MGLPLIEAAHYGCKIFAYETDVTKEVLKIINSKFFNKSNIESKYKEFLSFHPTTIGENINGFKHKWNFANKSHNQIVFEVKK